MVEIISQKEEQILQVAMQVFVEKGWHGARMQEIADRAGVNKAMLHYYFRNKERLYSAVLEKLFLKFVNSIGDSFIPGQTFAETLRIFLDRFHDHLLNNAHLPLFIARELSEGGKRARQVMEKIIDENRMHTPYAIINELKLAGERGEIMHIEQPVQFLLTLIGSCVYFFLAKPILEPMFPEIDFNSSEFIEQRKQMIFEQLYYGIKKRETPS
ncbi:TetR/AcrR family transcriptional regulator [Calditrichota bacterium GD2]